MASPFSFCKLLDGVFYFSSRKMLKWLGFTVKLADPAHIDINHSGGVFSPSTFAPAINALRQRMDTAPGLQGQFDAFLAAVMRPKSQYVLGPLIARKIQLALDSGRLNLPEIFSFAGRIDPRGLDDPGYLNYQVTTVRLKTA